MFFSSAVIKKRRYWPAIVSGKEMEDHFWEVEVEVGETDAVQVTFDGVI